MTTIATTTATLFPAASASTLAALSPATLLVKACPSTTALQFNLAVAYLHTYVVVVTLAAAATQIAPRATLAAATAAALLVTNANKRTR